MKRTLLRQVCGRPLSVTVGLILTLLMGLSSKAQVSIYTFSQSSGTFTSIKTTGTLIDTASNASAGNVLDTKGWSIALPFSFVFNGIPYTSIYANSDGGATFGTTTSTSSTVISSSTAYAGAIAAMNRDLWGIYSAAGNLTSGSNTITNVTSFAELNIGATLAGTGIATGATVTAIDQTAGTITMSANATSTLTATSVRWGTGKLFTRTTGNAPNRKFIIEWSNFSDYNTTANVQTRFSFQIILEETTNIVNVVYGDYANLSTSDRTNQIGLRGATNADYNNRTGTGAWTATTAGTSNSSTVTRNNVTYPASGLTFTWTPPSCFAPSGVTASVTTSSATVSWTAPGVAPANGYEYYYSTTNTAPTGATVPSGSTAAGVTSVNIPGLAAATTYYVWVRAACGATDKSGWAAGSFYTGHCVPTGATSYYLTGITTTGAVNNISYTASTGQGYVNNSATNIVTYAGNTINYTMTPSSGTNYFYIWVDWNNNLSFGDAGETILATTSYTSNTTGSFTVPAGQANGNYRIRFANSWSGAITACGPSSYGNYVDYTLQVGAVPSCFAPGTPTISNILANGATVSWAASTSAPANGYEYYYSTSNTAPTTTTTASGTTAAGVLTTNLTGLNANTNYYVWVRAACSATDKSAWTTITGFYTGPCIPTGGTSYYLTGITTTGAVTNIGYTASSGQGYVNNTATNIVSYAGNTINYSMTPSSGTNYFYIWVDWNNNLSFADSGETILATTSYASNTTGSFIVPAGQANGNYRIRFANSYSGTITACGPSSNGNYVDYTLQVGAAPSCFAPGTPTISNITATGATVSWTASTSAPANGYEYYYSTSNTAPTATATPGGITAAGVLTANLTGLAANTTYYVWVRSACGSSSKSAWTTAASFYTGHCIPTGATNYYLTGIATTGAMGNINYTTSTAQGYVNNTATNIVTYAGNTINYTLTPSSGTNYFYIWIDWNNNLSFGDAGETILATTSYTSNVTGSFTVPAGQANGNYRIRFANSWSGAITACGPSSYGNYVDYTLVVGAPPTCFTPGAPVASNVLLNSATLSWTASAPAPANGYEYYYSISNTAPTATTVPSGNTAAGVLTANITGLTANTTYYAWVRGNCSATDKSTWSTAVSFYTGYCTPAATSSSTYLNGLASTGAISNISNPATGFTTGGYADYYNTNSMTAAVGTTVNLNYNIVGGTSGVSVYVDLNNDLTFSTTERLYTSSAYLATGAQTAAITIPANTTPGAYRMRITTDFNSTTPVPCSFSSGRGEAEDYKIIVPNCTIPVVNLGNDTTICAGNTLTLNAGNAGATYSWSNGATTQTTNVTTAGTYIATVTNNVCVGRDTIVVTVSQPPVVNLGNDTAICAGNTLTLNAGNTGASYLWDNATTTQTRAVTTAGTYYVAVTNANGCKGRDTIAVTVTPLPVVNLGNDTFFCAGGSINLNATTTGATYLWDNASTAAIRNVNAAGTYYVKVTANMCSAPDTIVITQAALPVVNLGNDAALCGGNTMTLNAGNTGATYHWDNAATTQTRTVNTAGTYFVAVTNTNGCTGRDTIVITITPPPVVNLGNDTSFCSGGFLNLNATAPGATYLWDNASTAATRTVTAAGTYSVAVTANMCTTRDTIIVGQMPTPVVHLGNDTSICNGSAITINAGNAGAIYAWNTGAASQTIPVTIAGTYSVKVTTGLCSGTDTIVVSYVNAPAFSAINATYSSAATYYFHPVMDTQFVAGYTWNFGDGSPAVNGYMVSHTYNTNGIYTVTCTAYGICDGVQTATSRTVDVFDATGTTGIPDLKNDKDWAVYPNPANNVLTIENKAQVKIAEVAIYTITGQRIKTIEGTGATVKADVDALASGIYMLQVKSANGDTLIKKIEIRK